VRKDGGIPISTTWTRAMDRRLWGVGAMGLRAVRAKEGKKGRLYQRMLGFI